MKRGCRSAMCRAGLLLCLLGALSGVGRADGAPVGNVEYGPVPPSILAVQVRDTDKALATRALDALVKPPERRIRAGGHNPSRALLVMLGNAGLHEVAQRLAAGSVPAHARPHLLQVVAASPHFGADLLLARAAKERRPVLRMLAADGLGRGRTPQAVDVLATLARDPVPAVRAAALRSLFAIDTKEAAAARKAIPLDDEQDLRVARLRWHNVCRDASPALLEMATQAYRRGKTVPLRMVAARYLTLPELAAPIPLLLEILREMGTSPLLAAFIRAVSGLPERGYDTVEERRIVIAAALTLLARDNLTADQRRRVLRQAVWWVARPISMDPYSRDTIPEHRLRRRLPAFGREIIPPVLATLERRGFSEPRAGVLLLRELGPDLAMPIMRRLLEPRDEPPPFESNAEAEQRYYLRMAASGVLQEFGQVGDEALVRDILGGLEPRALKTEILRALERDPGAWVIPLLGELIAGEDRELASYARDHLEARLEPEARAILVADLFLRREQPHNRLPPLVRRGDEASFELLKRALTDRRPSMRKAALDQFHRRRNPRLCGREGRLLLRTYKPNLRSPQEIERYIIALLWVEPVRAVRYVRETWAQFPSDSCRETSLRQLKETVGKSARQEAIDFALELDGPDATSQMQLSIGAVLKGYWTYRPTEVSAFWRRLLESEDLGLRWEAIRALEFAGGPDLSELLLAQLRKALAPPDPDEEERDLVDLHGYARDILGALRHQPWEKVERDVIDVATGPHSEDTTREFAAQMLFGRLTEAGRKRLMVWLGFVPSPSGRAPGVIDNAAMQLHLAAAIGEGASASDAATLQATLKREVLDFYTPERMAKLLWDSDIAVGPVVAPPARAAPPADGDVEAPADPPRPAAHASSAVTDEYALFVRGRALARSIAHTRHVPAVTSLLELGLDSRFALYARISVQRQQERLQQAGPGAAAQVPSKLVDLAHQGEGFQENEYFGMPNALYFILSQVKVLDDDVLAKVLERVLQEARDDGRLAHFPDLYLSRLYIALIDKMTGSKPASAAVVHRFMALLEEVDSAVDFFARHQRSTDLSMEGRWREAAENQRHVVRILARRNHRDREPAVWRLQRARLDALEGAALASAGKTGEARDRFRRAVGHAPHDPDVLNTVAWERALVGFDLPAAEAEARLATTLEARVDSRPTLNAADTLAYVLLLSGKPNEARSVLEPRMRERDAVRDGILHLHMAQIHAALGRLEDAQASLINACTWDRTLEQTMEQDPHLKPLFEGAEGRAARIKSAAAARRIDEVLQ